MTLGAAYAIWTGIGAVGVVGAFCVGIFSLGEDVTLHRLASVAIIAESGRTLS